ncbi:MAG: hypothetical protein ABSG32_22615 [Terriglobia bacterium]
MHTADGRRLANPRQFFPAGRRVRDAVLTRHPISRCSRWSRKAGSGPPRKAHKHSYPWGGAGPTLEKIWQAGGKTVRLCAHETYMDCQYYERLQYAEDIRIEAPISLYMTNDDRLVKNAIECFNASRTPEGLTLSRYLAFLPQYIVPFSLFWIDMMHDMGWYHGDADFLRSYLLNMRGVLSWFQPMLNSSGLVAKGIVIVVSPATPGTLTV